MFTAKVFVVGEICKTGVIVTLAVAVADVESVTRMTAVPLVPGAVYNPVLALIEPPPLSTEYVYGVAPLIPANVYVLLATIVTPAGFIPSPVTTVTVVLTALPKLSVTVTMSVPAPTGAV